MGSPPLDRQPSEGVDDASRPLVAFDFDGTLTTRDSFTAFLRWRAGPGGYLWGLARLLPALAAYAAHRNRGRLKAAAVRVFLRGVPEAELTAAARRFADDTAPILLRPDALRAWERHRAEGARLVIVTASPEEVVGPFAELLRADRLLGTRLALDGEGRVLGAFAGENCRGQEKVSRLRLAFGEDVRLAAAYGDTGGDREMLAIADVPGYRVFGGVP